MKIKSFGQWLKHKLKTHKIKQSEFAAQICVAENTVTSWCTDTREPTIRNWKWICKYVALLEEEEDMTEEQKEKLYCKIILESSDYF
tara:strand:+ start:35 stop:295 length:261 start_codon:yes stop_codon:yes gene_type:complete